MMRRPWKMLVCMLISLILGLCLLAGASADDNALNPAIFEVPSEIEAGSDLNVNVILDERAAYHIVMLLHFDSSSATMVTKWVTRLSSDAETFLIDGCYLLDEGQYQMKITSYIDMWTYADNDQPFSVSASSVMVGPQLSLPDELYTYQLLQMSIDLEGADKIIVNYYQYDGGVFRQYQSSDFYTSADGSFSWYKAFYLQGKWAVRLSAHIGDRWTALSDFRTIEVVEQPPLSETVFTISSDEISTTDDLTISIDAMPEAYYCNVTICDATGSPIYEETFFEVASDLIVYFPAQFFQLSGSYEIEVCFGGYSPFTERSSAVQTLSVIGDSIVADMPVIDLDKMTELKKEDYVTFTVQANGTISEAMYSYYFEDLDDWSYGSFETDLDYYSYGYYAYEDNADGIPFMVLPRSILYNSDLSTVTMRFRFKIDEIWTDWTDIYTFEITDQILGFVNYPVYMISSTSANLGEVLKITSASQEHVQSYEIDIVSADGVNRNTTIVEIDTLASWSALIDTCNLAPGNWSVSITPVPEEQYILTGIPCVYALSIKEPSTMILPSSLSAIEEQAFSGTALEKVVIPDGCTSIGSLAFANSPTLTVVVIPESVTDIASNAFINCGKGLTIRTTSTAAAYTYALEHNLYVIAED